MSDQINHSRRRSVGAAGAAIAAAPVGVIRPARGQSSKADAPSSKPGSHTSMGSIKQIDAGLLSIGCANYRWRLGLAKGEAKYDALEAKLSKAPVITVPAITIASDFDGALADGKAYQKMFAGKYSHRILAGIGHNVPQEAAEAFAKAVVAVDGYTA